MGQVPSKFFPAPMPYGASPAANVLNPTQPAAQNAQVPLLPPNFTDPGKLQAQTVAQNVTPGGGGPQNMNRLFGRGLFGMVLLLLFSSWASATTTVTGKINDLGTGGVTSVFVRFWLRGCQGVQPRINGTALLAPTQGGTWYKDFIADASGNISGTVYSTRDASGTGNGEIECPSSVYNATWYGLQLFFAGKGGPETPVAAKNGVTLNVTNVTPLSATPPVQAPTGDTVYLRMDGGNSPATGNIGFTGVTTAGLLNNCYIVDGVKFTTIQAAIAAAPATGCVYIPAGIYAPTSTITINKTLNVYCESSASTIITPTNAVTGAAIAITPPVQDQIILRGCDLEMTSVPGIPAITVNNMGANSEINGMIINGGTIGIDITNSSVLKIHDNYITNQTLFGIRDNADGGAEHHYDAIWLINNNSTLAPTTTALFEYVRTNTTDTGGLYMNNVRAIANVLGGTVTNGLLITSSAGGRTIIHSHIADTICDGNFNGDCVVLNNVQRVSVEGGQWGTSHINANCSAATVSCFASVSITGSAQIDFSPNVKLISNNRDISLSGAVDRVTVAQSQLFGSATAATGGHIYVVTGATLTNLSINSPNYDSATTYSNNEAALIAASSTAYVNTGSGSNSGIGLGDGATATPSLFFRADLGLGCWRSTTNTVTCNTTPSGPVWRWDNTGLTIISTFAFKPSAAGGVDVGTTLLPFGCIYSGTAATNNFKFCPPATAAQRAISWTDPGGAANWPFTNNTSTTTTQVLHATATAGLYTTSAIATADIATALTTPGPIGGTTPSTGKFTSMTATNLLWNTTAPTIAGAGCGGTLATISANNGTAAFSIFTGTAPTSACTVTMPAATTGWVCEANTVSATSTTNFIVKQTGAVSTTSVVLTLFTDVAATQSYTASDTIRVKCSAY